MTVAFRVGLVLLSVAVLQRGVLSQIRIAGVSVDLFLLVAVAAGIAAGPERGAVIGFFSGLTLDLLVATPLGLSALVYCLAGFSAGRLHGTTVRSSRRLTAGLVLAVSAAAVGGYAVLGELLGQEGAVGPRLAAVLVVVPVTTTVLAPVGLRVLRWAVRDERDLRPALR